MIIYNIEQGSEAWHAIRAGKVTGTRFKTLVSGKSTKGYNDLIAEIAGEIITGAKEPSYTNAIMERGIEMESEAADHYAEIFDKEIKEVGFVAPNEDDDFYNWIGVSPDRLVYENENLGLIEIKCPLMKTHINYIKANKLPNEYKYQVQGQLFVTGAKWCDFMSYYPNMKPFIKRIYPDTEIFEKFENRMSELIEAVKIELETYKRYDYYG